MTFYNPLTPWQRAFIAARDPLTARNALGILPQPTWATTPVAVSGLPTPTAALKGARAFVTDSNTTTFHATVAGAGTNAIGVTCDGTVWYVG
jgi:streptogramin lyase